MFISRQIVLGSVLPRYKYQYMVLDGVLSILIQVCGPWRGLAQIYITRCKAYVPYSILLEYYTYTPTYYCIRDARLQVINNFAIR